MFNNLKNFKPVVLYDGFKFIDKYNKTHTNYIPGIKNIKQEQFMYNGKYTSVKTKDDDYNNIDILTDYFIEPVRIKAVVKSQKISPEQYYLNNEKQLIEILEKECLPFTNYNMRELLFKQVKEATLFKLSLCKSMLYILSPDNDTTKAKWLDISAGWGDRLITAIACDVEKYVGFDPNTELQKGHTSIINTFGGGDTDRFKVIYEPFEKGIDSISVQIPQGSFNVVFTSPPFFDFEQYSKQKTQSTEQYDSYDKWKNEFLFVSIGKAYNHLEVNGKLALYIVDIGGHSIVSSIFTYIETNCKDLQYIGMIASVSSSTNKIPKPTWIWQRK